MIQLMGRAYIKYNKFNMNKLKFRVWDKITKSFLNECATNYWHVPYSFNGEELEGEANLHNLSDILNSDSFIVQEFTGCKDSNGKDIYDGDILKRESLEILGADTIHEVTLGLYTDYEYVTHIECWMWGSTSSISLSEETRNSHRNKKFKYTVIGNILENPELMTQ